MRFASDGQVTYKIPERSSKLLSRVVDEFDLMYSFPQKVRKSSLVFED